LLVVSSREENRLPVDHRLYAAAIAIEGELRGEGRSAHRDEAVLDVIEKMIRTVLSTGDNHPSGHVAARPNITK
jgi:hypothetical protein